MKFFISILFLGLVLAQDLSIGGIVYDSDSSPIVDAGWLPKSFQVGKSGLKVNPKVYIALGISGAPEHLEGMKDVSTIIAVNTDKNAPIFDFAHYGMTEDLFDICEELGDSL